MMPSAATIMLRTSVARSCARGTIVLGCPTAVAVTFSFSSPFHTVSRPPAELHQSPRRSPLRPAVTTNKPPAIAMRWLAATRRSASSKPLSDPTIDAATRTSAISQEQAHPEPAPLDWNTFFRLRKTRRWWQLVFSVLLGGTGAAGGGTFLSTGVADPLVKWIPLDPFVTLAMMTTGFGLLGWLAGPSAGGLVFGMLQRRHRAQMAVKESQFFARIKKHRVDPSSSSASNPVPDYYGEKISSIAGYRQWLKDQRAFNKKRTTFV